MSRDLDALTSATLKHLRERWWDGTFTYPWCVKTHRRFESAAVLAAAEQCQEFAVAQAFRPAGPGSPQGLRYDWRFV